MNRKIITVLTLAVILFLPILIFYSCSNSPNNPASNNSTQEPSVQENISTTLTTVTPEETDMFGRLRQIQSNWTEQQVFDLLGEPDRTGEASVVAQVFYSVGTKSEAIISFWSEGIEIIIYNSESRERTVLLERPIAQNENRRCALKL